MRHLRGSTGPRVPARRSEDEDCDGPGASALDRHTRDPVWHPVSGLCKILMPECVHSDWVLQNARSHVVDTFNQLRLDRYQSHVAYLQSLPCFTLYYRYNGQPPMHPTQLHILHSQITQANALFKQGVDEDWRRSCMRYPEVLDHYFNRVVLTMPDNIAPSHAMNGLVATERPRVKAKKNSVDAGSGRDSKRRDRRLSRGETPPAPPRAPMPGAYR